MPTARDTPRTLVRYVDLSEVDELVAAFTTALGMPVSLLGSQGEVVSGPRTSCHHCTAEAWRCGVFQFLATGGQFLCPHGLTCLLLPVRARDGEPLATVAVGPVSMAPPDAPPPEPGAQVAQAGGLCHARGPMVPGVTPARATSVAQLVARTFETIAREAQIANESADLEALQRQANRDLSVLYAVARALNSSPDLQTMLDRLVAVLSDVLDVDVVLVGLIEAHELVNTASSGLRTREARQGRLKVGEGLAGRVAQSGQPLVTQDMQADPREYMTATNTREHLHGYAGVPIVAGTRTVGVLSLYYRHARLASENEVQILARIAELIAIAMERVADDTRDSPAPGTLQNLRDEAQSYQRAMTRIHDIHDQLSQIVLHDGGLDEIVSTLARLLDAQVALEDAYHHILAQGAAPAGGAHVRETGPAGNDAALPPQAIMDHEVQLLYAVAREARRPLTVPAMPQIGLARSRIVAPIMAGVDLLGYLTIVDEPSLQADTQMLAISHATTVIALEMLKQRTSMEFERRLRGEALEELVDGAYPDRGRMQRKAEYLGHDLATPHALVAISADHADVSARSSGRTSRASLTDILQDVASAHAQSAMLMSRSDGVGLAMPIPSGEMADVRRSVLSLHREALRRGIGAINIGVGRLCRQLEDYPPAWIEARRALSFARSLDASQSIVVYEDLGVARLLLDLPDASNAVRFAQQLLAPLEAHDARHNGMLLDTLEAFLCANGVLQRAATAMAIHVNTITYRLQRIQDLTGLDLRDSDSRLEAHIAIKIRNVVRRSVV